MKIKPFLFGSCNSRKKKAVVDEAVTTIQIPTERRKAFLAFRYRKV